MRMGFAGTFVKLKNFTGGIAFDLAFPSFQNIVFATGIDLVFINMISLIPKPCEIFTAIYLVKYLIGRENFVLFKW
mgnify:CR=1 FL=1